MPRHHFLQYCSTFTSCATSARLAHSRSSRGSRRTSRNSIASSETPKLTLSSMESVMWSRNSSSDKYCIHSTRRLSSLRMSSLKSNNLHKAASQSRLFSSSLQQTIPSLIKCRSLGVSPRKILHPTKETILRALFNSHNRNLRQSCKKVPAKP